MTFSLFKFWKRAVARDDCRVDATLHLKGGIALPGMILKIGPGLVLFREASDFVLVRDGAGAKVAFDGGEIEGIITRSTDQGYLIRATDPVVLAA
ncbi:MAG: hypothetical protein FGM26_04445 [Beijerinckiaceae bacterium]|nr:hypothetical protein [Beijerinckiaceae bacterium]